MLLLLLCSVLSHVGAGVVHVAAAGRPAQASQAVSQLSAADHHSAEHVGQLRHHGQVLAAFAVQDRHDRDAVVERRTAPILAKKEPKPIDRFKSNKTFFDFFSLYVWLYSLLYFTIRILLL